MDAIYALNPFANYESRRSFTYVMSWAWFLLAVFLCYRCNVYETLVLRIIYMIVAMLFYPYYLLYYLIYHGVLRRPCANPFGSVGVVH